MTPGIRKLHARAPSAGTGGDIVDALRADHLQMAALFDRFMAVAKSDSLAAVRGRLAHCICDELSARRFAEEEVLYPEVREEDDKLVFALQLADQGVAMRIAEIRDPEVQDFERDLAVLRLIGMVRRHIGEREQVLFPLLRSRMDALRRQSLAAAFAQRKLLHTLGAPAQAAAPAPSSRSEDAAVLPWRMRAAPGAVPS